MENGALISFEPMQLIIRLVQGGLTSTHSKRAYRKELDSFLDWYNANGQRIE